MTRSTSLCWSPAEDDLLINTCKLLGSQWDKVANCVDRSKDECAARWTKIMPATWKSFSTIIWSDECILTLIQAIHSLKLNCKNKLGDSAINWSVVAAIVGFYYPSWYGMNVIII